MRKIAQRQNNGDYEVRITQLYLLTQNDSIENEIWLSLKYLYESAVPKAQRRNNFYFIQDLILS